MADERAVAGAWVPASRRREGGDVDIVMISQLFPPETAAGANRVAAFASALHERFGLRVVTLEPGYPDPKLYPRTAWRESDRARGIPIKRIPAFRPHDPSLMRRALREIVMSLSLVWAARGGVPDVILVSTPSMFLAPAGWLSARLSGARFVWDVRDLTWRYAKECVATGGGQHRLLDWLETLMLWLLRRTDLVIAATAGLGQVLLEQGVPAAKMITVSNGVSKSFLDVFSSAASTGRSARPRVTYVGLMGYNHGIGILLDVARLLPGVDVYLVGDGPERPAIEDRLRDGKLANVVLCGYVTDPAELAGYYLSSDVLVNHTKDTPILNQIVYPAKIFEYFATRRPVVYAGAGFAANLLRERDLALVVPPNDPVALARGIEEVLGDPHRASERSERARRSVETEFCREVQLRTLSDELERRFGGARPETLNTRSRP